MSDLIDTFYAALMFIGIPLTGAARVGQDRLPLVPATQEVGGGPQAPQVRAGRSRERAAARASGLKGGQPLNELKKGGGRQAISGLAVKAKTTNDPTVNGDKKQTEKRKSSKATVTKTAKATDPKDCQRGLCISYSFPIQPQTVRYGHSPR